MAAEKYTPWFSEGTKPSRRGVYEVMPIAHIGGRRESRFQHWNGKVWGLRSLNKENAELYAGVASSLAPWPKWRGLAGKPNAAV